MDMRALSSRTFYFLRVSDLIAYLSSHEITICRSFKSNLAVNLDRKESDRRVENK